MSINDILNVSVSGMQAQSMRMRIIAENMANSGSTGSTPGADPYRRQEVTFRSFLDKDSRAQMVRVDRVSRDQSEFGRRFDPSHPAANKDGYVLLPNVNSIRESVDMRDAQRSYEANLSMIDMTRQLLQRTADLLRSS